MSHVFSKNLRNQRTSRYQKILCNYYIIAQKLLILKQGLKTINAKFIQTHALSQLSFVQFRLSATLFSGLLILSLTSMPKSKKTLETSLDLLPSFRTSLDAKG